MDKGMESYRKYLLGPCDNRTRIIGDYDGFKDLEELISFIRTGKGMGKEK